MKSWTLKSWTLDGLGHGCTAGAIVRLAQSHRGNSGPVAGSPVEKVARRGSAEIREQAACFGLSVAALLLLVGHCCILLFRLLFGISVFFLDDGSLFN